MFCKSFPAIFIILLLPLTALQTQPVLNYAPDELIVKFKPETAERTLFDDPDILDREDFDIEVILPLSPDKKHGTMLIKFEGPLDIKATKLALEKSGNFIYVEFNYIGYGSGVATLNAILPNDAHFDRQWGLLNDGSFTLSDALADADIDMEDAWEIEQGDPSVLVAILDSGIKLNHPEFEGRIWQNPLDPDGNGDGDMNGLIDDFRGWDFANEDNNPSDDVGHGTNIAGIFGAIGDNDIGYAGIDWHCTIMPLKILDHNNSGFYSWWISAIYYAVEHGARVLNMSVGGQSFSKAMEEAVDFAYQNGVTITASMMNTNTDSPYYPAAYENVIAVGSVDPDDSRSVPFFWDPQSGSNYGNHIDVVAPGNYIFGPDNVSNTNYNGYWGGTSQATGYVTGIVSLLLAHNPLLFPDQIREIVEGSAEDMVGKPAEDTEGWDRYYGHGRINAYAALTMNTTATHDQLRQDGITISPNPVSDNYFQVQLTEPNTIIIGYRIIGSDGFEHRSVSKITAGQDRISVPIHHLSPGNYILIVNAGNDRYALRFVKAL